MYSCHVTHVYRTYVVGDRCSLAQSRAGVPVEVVERLADGITAVEHVDCLFFFSSRRRHTRLQGDWSSDVCSSDLRRVILRPCSPSSTTRIAAYVRQRWPGCASAAASNLSAMTWKRCRPAWIARRPGDRKSVV